MSWNIDVAGSKERVTELVTKAEGHGDTSQLEAARALILSEIAVAPTERWAGRPTGLRIKAYGHHDDHNRSMTIEIALVDI